jgi:hypothetical protein
MNSDLDYSIARWHLMVLSTVRLVYMYAGQDNPF